MVRVNECLILLNTNKVQAFRDTELRENALNFRCRRSATNHQTMHFRSRIRCVCSSNACGNESGD